MTKKVQAEMADSLNNLFFDEEAPHVDISIKTEIKKSISIKTCLEHTHIFVLAFDKFNNKLTSIIYKEKSTPMGGYVYDAKFGRYYVECYDYMDLGTIPISFSIRIGKIGRWECKIPLTESIIRKYLDGKQAAELAVFKKENKNRRLEFMQLVSCY